MTHAMLTRRLTALVGQIENIRRRIDVLAKDTAPQDKNRTKKQTTKKSKTSKKTSKRTSSRKNVIGRTIVYGGARAKVIEKDGSQFIAKANGKKAFRVSTTYVYRQLSA